MSWYYLENVEANIWQPCVGRPCSCLMCRPSTCQSLTGHIFEESQCIFCGCTEMQFKRVIEDFPRREKVEMFNR